MADTTPPAALTDDELAAAIAAANAAYRGVAHLGPRSATVKAADAAVAQLTTEQRRRTREAQVVVPPFLVELSTGGTAYAAQGADGQWQLYVREAGTRLASSLRAGYPTREAADAALPAAADIHDAEIGRRRVVAAAVEEQPVRTAGSPRYSTVHSSAFGPGRVYVDQPGATQYDDGSGRYSIQIWDN